MPNYILVLRDDPASFASLSPAEMEAIIMRYVEWRRSRTAAGQVLECNKLQDGSGGVLSGGTVTEGRFA